MKNVAISFFLFFLIISLTSQAQDEERRRGRDRRPAEREQPKPQAPRAPEAPPTPKNGSLYGVVVDGVTGETLVEVLIRVQGTNIVAVSDYDGNYRIDDLPPGDYTLTAEMLQYEPLKIENITLGSGQTLKLPMALSSADHELETVVITGEAAKNSDAAVISVQRNSTVIMDGFSGNMILEQTPGFQLSMALQRMPGVAMIEDRLLSIRGLYERYTNLTLNGAIMPFSDFERSGFDYNSIPAKLVSSIGVVKSARSDQVSEFAGGLVQLQTSDIPVKNEFSASMQFYYNDLATFKNFQGYPQSGGGWSPAPSYPHPTDVLPGTQQLAALPDGSPQRYDAVRNYKPNYQGNGYTAPPGTNTVLSLQRRYKIGERAAGFTASVSALDHYHSETQRTFIFGKYLPEKKMNAIGDSSQGSMSRRVQNLTAMLNGGIELRNGKITLHNLLVLNTTGSYYPAIGNVYDSTGAVSQVYNFPIMRLSRNVMWSTQAGGKHHIALQDKRAVTVEWDANLSHLLVEEPSYRAITYIPGDSVQWVLSPTAGSEYDASFSSVSNATVSGGNVAATYTLLDNLNVKAGLFTYHRVRRYRSRLLGPAFSEDFNMSEAQFDLKLGDKVFNPENYRPGGLNFYEYTTGAHNYNAQRHLWAGYIMPEWRPTNRLFIQAGLRLEQFNQRIDTLGVADGTSAQLLKNSKTDLLPAINTIYYLNDRTNLRFSYGQTVVRPNERELVPLAFLDLVLGSYTSGNPDLKRTKVHNLDLKWERFGQANQLFSAGVFYKYFKNPIEQVFTKGVTKDSATVQQVYLTLNQQSAQSMGVEVEVRWNPGYTFDIEALKNFRTYGNMTLQRSSINTDSPFEVFSGGRTLQGQANYVINLGLLYATPETKWSFGLFYNRVGPRIAFVGAGDTTFSSIWEMPRDMFDIQVGKSFGPFSVRLILNDIINQPFRLVQIYDGRRRYDPNKDQISKYVTRNMRVFLTLSYNI